MFGIKKTSDEDGASSPEYAIIAALIAAIIVGTVSSIGQKVLTMFSSVSF